MRSHCLRRPVHSLSVGPNGGRGEPLGRYILMSPIGSVRAYLPDAIDNPGQMIQQGHLSTRTNTYRTPLPFPNTLLSIKSVHAHHSSYPGKIPLLLYMVSIRIYHHMIAPRLHKGVNKPSGLDETLHFTLIVTACSGRVHILHKGK